MNPKTAQPRPIKTANLNTETHKTKKTSLIVLLARNKLTCCGGLSLAKLKWVCLEIMRPVARFGNPRRSSDIRPYMVVELSLGRCSQGTPRGKQHLFGGHFNTQMVPVFWIKLCRQIPGGLGS